MNINIIHSKLLLFLFIVLCFHSCTYDTVTPATVIAKQLPDTVSFSKDIIPVFVNNCDQSGCHSGAIPSNRLALDSSLAYIQLHKKGSGYLDTINPVNSILYASIISVSDPMPPVGKLDNYYIQLLLKWITQGAKNN